MRYEIKSIGIWSLVKTTFFVNALVGLICGMLTVPFLSLLVVMATQLPGGRDMGIDPSDLSFGDAKRRAVEAGCQSRRSKSPTCSTICQPNCPRDRRG